MIPPQHEELRHRLAEAWRERRPLVLARLEVIAAGAEGTAGSERAAAMEAHKLAGSLGAFGHTRAARIARRVERLLTEPRDPDVEDDLRRAVAELRALAHDGDAVD